MANKQGPKVRKNGSAFGNACRAYQGHISIAFVALVMVALTGVFGNELQAMASKMTSLSYHNDSKPGHYGAGADDMYLIGFLAIFFIFVRIVLKFTLFDKLASIAPCDTEKFTMQGWQFVYYFTAWTSGFYMYCKSDYFLDGRAMFVGYPQSISMTTNFKLYYLCQAAFWCQMVFVTLIEVWQKDFIQMMLHHFITIFLVTSSYYTGFLFVGHTVLVEQDFGDIFLPAAKMFKYFNEAADRRLGAAAKRAARHSKHAALPALEACDVAMKDNRRTSKEWKEARKKKTELIQTIIEDATAQKDERTLSAVTLRQWRLDVHGNICDLLFTTFAIVWIPTRHGMFLWICYHIWFHAEQVVRETGLIGYHPEQGAYFMPGVTIPVYAVILGAFQVLMLMWLMDLIKAVLRTLTGPKNVTEIEDPHEVVSDDEDEDEEDDEELEKKDQ